jgi:hypothetical protein
MLACIVTCLVDLVEICKVAAERALPHVLPALSEGNNVSVPLGGRCVPSTHPPVQISRELEPDFSGGADHYFCLGNVGLETYTFKSTVKTVYCPLQEDKAPCCYVRIIYIKDCKLGIHHLIQPPPSSSDSSLRIWSHSLTTASTITLKSLAKSGPPWFTPCTRPVGQSQVDTQG